MAVHKKYPALGRGLDALISTKEVHTDGSSTINEIELDKISPNPNQPRRDFDPESLRELADSYKEAQVAIEVGKVFENEKPVIHYDNLGIGRIIYQLPTTLCEMFLSEAFKKNPIEALDEDTLDTINRFFENNLNVSETARKLYVHRNTLVYRLEKVKKITGLDLREFEDAILFKVAVMVKQYLDSQNTAKF